MVSPQAHTLPVSRGPTAYNIAWQPGSRATRDVLHGQQSITHHNDEADRPPYQIDHERLLLDHHIYHRRISVHCLKRAADLHEKRMPLSVAVPMCLLDLLPQILKPKERMGRNVKWLEQQNLVLFLRHGGFECLCLRVSALAKLPQRIGLTVTAVCQQSSTTGSPISARAECDGIVRGLPNLLNHVLLQSIYCHTGQGYMRAGVTAALFQSNIPSCSSRGNALPTLMPYSTCVVFSIASLKPPLGSQFCKLPVRIASLSSALQLLHLFRRLPCHIAAR